MPANVKVPPIPIHRLTVKQYHQMIETGVLTEDDPVELLEGWMVTRLRHNPLHDGTITQIQKRLERVLPAGWFIRIQSAITTRDSEPEPDLAIISGPVEKYFTRHPALYDMGLIIELPIRVWSPIGSSRPGFNRGHASRSTGL